jgi:hypothetical protein
MGWVANATLRPLYPLERPRTHCTQGWVGSRAGLDGCGKSRPQLGFYPRTVQLVSYIYVCIYTCIYMYRMRHIGELGEQSHSSGKDSDLFQSSPV